MDLSAGLGAVIGLGVLTGISTTDDGSAIAVQAEAAVHECGYATSPVTRAAEPGMLPWIIPPEPSAESYMFFARDPEDIGRHDGRLFTVVVFPDEERAQRLYAAARDGAVEAPEMMSDAPAFRSDAFSPDRGPILVRGAGHTLWRGRLAAFQLTAPAEPAVIDIAIQLRKQGAELATATPEQLRRAIGEARGQLKARSHDDLASSAYGVDRDFVDCLSEM
jgi:hypothetical protein